MYHLPVNARNATKLMTVNGKGSVNAQPDTAYMTLGVRTGDIKLETAQAINAETMNEVTAALQELGVTDEQIQTINYSITPQYDYVDGQQVFREYEVVHVISVTTNQMDDIGVIIDTAVSHGVNQVAEVSFSLASSNRFYQEALHLAVRNARVHAETIARTLELQLAAVPVTIAEKPPLSSDLSVYALQAATPIAPGQLTITAEVEVQYAYAAPHQRI
ncbi:hypothetical protein SAMN05192534_101395 [Alteribacillus persepolensis]|uniref:DUF541 domain-containing protein n=1 Tax=Alteribacillus persepolensis TaxID=568899 RepID=A0A1G7Z3X6_9BACI|nr:SIMPL domain-containing protein [Alteribacillus persepolensis]SDH03472.1 hypothetical protein SAMN05192534_101395 [Alteribacillus persepolensis]